MANAQSDPVALLIQQGVQIPAPSLVTVDLSVNIERIAPGVVIHPGCRIIGEATSIGPGCVLGEEGIVTLDNCQLGARVRLAGGFFSQATFLDQASMGPGAHVRPGTLLEEEAAAAHTVGLKQTVLFPFAILGSLINFCDALVSGGTSRQNHSEIGSSYIHFNFTPHQDKATPSLIGDVPRGVMLDQPPIFLGGQGGLVGPARIEFGAVIPAGLVVRGDIRNGGLYLPEPGTRKSAPQFRAGAYQAINRILINNLHYIGNIQALRAWYRQVRSVFLDSDPFQAACFAGANERLDAILAERIQRLRHLAESMPHSLALAKSGPAPVDLNAQPYLQQTALIERWPRMLEQLLAPADPEGDEAKRDRFLEALARIPARTDYLNAIKNLPPDDRAAGTAWLESIVAAIVQLWPPL
jgi:UDP-N-acetylglucosamine/UDP-N-acetylgalactosamine diphosphorylase